MSETIRRATVGVAHESTMSTDRPRGYGNQVSLADDIKLIRGGQLVTAQSLVINDAEIRKHYFQ